MTSSEKSEALLVGLSGIRGSQERLAFVVDYGRRQPALPEEFKTDAYRVEGCLAQLWLVPECKGTRCVFRADSDSAIMKGIAALLCDFYSELTPVEVLEAEPVFLLQAGITQHLAVNRRNGLSRVIENIRQFARNKIKPSSAEVSAMPHEGGGEA